MGVEVVVPQWWIYQCAALLPFLARASPLGCQQHSLRSASSHTTSHAVILTLLVCPPPRQTGRDQHPSTYCRASWRWIPTCEAQLPLAAILGRVGAGQDGDAPGRARLSVWIEVQQRPLLRFSPPETNSCFLLCWKAPDRR